MKLSAILAPMIAAGVSGDVILDTVRAFEEQRDDAIEKRRQNDRDRKARQREIEAMSREVTGSHNDRQPSAPRARVEDSSSKEEISEKENKRARATRLPPDWTLPDDWRDEAIASGLPSERVSVEARKMLNWSLSDTKGAKLDWRATWKNWVQRALESLARTTAPPNRRRTVVDVAMERVNGHGSESIFGGDSNAQRLPARISESRPDDGDIRGGLARRIVPSGH